MSQATNGDMEQAMDEKQKRQLESQGIQAAKSEAVNGMTNHINSICDTDVSPIKDAGLENYLSRDFVLAYFDDADIQELYWDMQIYIEMLMADAPDEGDEIDGDEEMAFIFGIDPDEVRTEPLNQAQKTALNGARQAFRARTTRAKGMKQQEMLTKTTNESVVRRPESEGGGGGLLSFLP